MRWLSHLTCGLFVAAFMVIGSGAQQARAQEIVTEKNRIDIQVSRGSLIRLPKPATGVFIADPNIADVQAQSETVIYLFGKASGDTSLFAIDKDDEIVGQYLISVTHNLTSLNSVLSQSLDSTIMAKPVNNGILLYGSAKSSADVEDARQIAGRYLGEDETLINRISLVNSTQVNLHVRIAEVSRSVGKVFGINWESILTPGNFIFGLASGRTLQSNGFARFSDQEGPVGAIFGEYSGGSVSIDGVVDALEREGFVTVLAQPNLTALSGETASFLAGGEFPVPVGVDDGQIQVEFKEFGVSLDFTPTVLRNERISLKVKPEVSELSDNGAINLNNIVIPALSTRRAETTVELGHGQSFAIGGLVSTNTRNNIEKFPGFGDLPILGTLFRSNDFRQNQSELVIIITPYLVQPVAEQTISTPLDGIAPPTDVERILHGKLASSSAGKNLTKNQLANQYRLRGNAGFILE